MVGPSPDTKTLGLATMAGPTLNFMSYNCTGIDRVKIDWIKDLIETCDIDFLQIQEHFKATKSVDSFFKREFDNSDSYVVPAFREPFQDSGRAKGGLAEISAKGLAVKKERIKTKHWRIQAQILHLENYRILWINTYLPTDPRTLQYNGDELNSVLTEIENILDSCDFHDCILGGDLNYYPRRTSGFVRIIREFMDNVGLFSVWNKYPVDFTHVHTDNKGTSILDHFFVNQELLARITDAGPIHLGDNRSRHSPIMMKIEIVEIEKSENQPKLQKQRKPAWCKATKDQVNEYTDILQQKLANIPIPTTLLCNNPNCTL